MNPLSLMLQGQRLLQVVEIYVEKPFRCSILKKKSEKVSGLVLLLKMIYGTETVYCRLLLRIATKKNGLKLGRRA